MIHISLFSGIGGFELAAEWMGWRNYVSCDISEFGNKVRKYYWPDCYSHNDVKTLTYEIINRELSARYGPGWRDDDIILTGGFPCQPYSSAGKRLGKDDERHLFPEMLRVIQEIKPTYIVGENVYGLVNWSEGLVFEEVCADLEAIGYEVQPVLLPASSIGAPHHRMRVWFVAYCDSNGSGSQYEFRTRGNLSKEWIDKCGIAPDTSSVGLCTNSTRQQFQSSSFGTQFRMGCGNAPDTDSDGQHQFDSEYEVNTSQGGEYAQCDSNSMPSNWQNFPTQSPICSGDDGLPNRLDGITFPKWRQQSIMAYGNAVVPQLVYTIFKAIDELRSKDSASSSGAG